MEAPLTLAEMRKFDGTLFVKNLTGTTITCNTPKMTFQLSPAGTSDSIKVLPEEALAEAGFQKMFLKGKIRIAPDMDDEAAVLAMMSDAEVEQRRKDIDVIIEESASSRDITVAECLVSGVPVLQTPAEVRDLVPPLAEEFKDRAHEYAAHQVMGEDGNQKTVFSKIQIG